VLARLNNRPVFVSETNAGFTIVLDAACESQDGKVLAELGASLSAQFHCPVLAILNHDDDILYFELYENGEKTDEYNSSPAYFSEDEDAGEEPIGGNAPRLAAVFGASDASRIERVLRASAEDYMFQTDRHRDLAEALGVPAFWVGVGHTYAKEGDLPPWVPAGTYVPSNEEGKL
jgi:hypothetical protein